MVLTDGQRKFTYIVSITGALQGTAWFIMSLICIVLHYKGVIIDNPSHYIEAYNLLLYITFLSKDAVTNFSDYIVTPEIFTIFMWIYFVSGIIWIISSIFLFIATQDNKSQRILRASNFWISITGVVSLIDLILCILIGIDFNKCTSLFDTTTTNNILNEMMCYNIWIPVMTYAARGYVLWIVNVVFIYYLYKNRKSTLQHVNPPGIQIPQIPRPVIQPNLQRSVNPNFMPNNDNNFYPNYWHGQNSSRSPPQTPTGVQQFNQNRWTNQWETNSNDGRTVLQSPVYSGHNGRNQPKYVY